MFGNGTRGWGTGGVVGDGVDSSGLSRGLGRGFGFGLGDAVLARNQFYNIATFTFDFFIE